MVLADDNFSSMERAVAEGRRIYDNLTKPLMFLLPTNGAQSLVILVAVLFGLALPQNQVQILWTNLVTAMNSWFGTAPLDAVGWLVPLGLSAVIFLLVEVGKAFLRRYP